VANIWKPFLAHFKFTTNLQEVCHIKLFFGRVHTIFLEIKLFTVLYITSTHLSLVCTVSLYEMPSDDYMRCFGNMGPGYYLFTTLLPWRLHLIT
jgi:hypothetical protein